MRIRSLLLQMAAVVVLPGFLAALMAVSKVRESERDIALKGLVETARATALLVDGEVKQSLGALTALAASEHLQSGDLKAFYDQASAVDEKPNVWTLLLDSTGTQRLNTAVEYGAPPPAPVALDRVTAVLTSRKPTMSDLILGPVTKTLLTTLYLPARPSPKGDFVVAQDFAVSHWVKEMQRPSDRADWIIAIIDRTGRFIWRSHRAEEYLGQSARSELVAAASASHSGQLRLRTLEGIDSYQAFTHSELTGWTIAVAAPVRSIEASAVQAVTWLSVGAALALMVGLITASVLSQRLVVLFRAAAAAAESLGRGEKPKPVSTPLIEFQTLDHSLQAASQRLSKETRARENLELEREQLLQAERSARVVAQEENIEKDRFLALLGHELRNPLAAISGSGDVLRRGAKDLATQQRFVAIIQRQTLHLRRIVDDLLNVSRMLRGKIVLDAYRIDLGDCMTKCVEAIRCTERANDYRWLLKSESVWIHGDPVRVEQIINNLVVNAMNFSPAEAEIRITVRGQRHHAILEVSDAGPGVAPELRTVIFEPFKQGPPMTGRQPTGLGIGLALVRQLVELHGGDVRVHGSGMGDGSTFAARFPCTGSQSD